MVIKELDNLIFKIVNEDYYQISDEIISHYYNEYTILLNYLNNNESLKSYLNIPKKIEIIVLNKLYDISYDGGVFDEKIIIFGFSKNNGLITHEMIHLFFLSKFCQYNEGLADYISNVIYGTQCRYTWENIEISEVLISHIKNKYSKKYDNYYNFFKDNKNYNSLELSKIPFTHSLGCIFIEYLIKTIGFEKYLNEFHFNDNINKNYEENMFNSFIKQINFNNINTEKYDDYFIKENELYEKWKNLKIKHNIDISVDIIEYSNNNWYYFTKKEKEEIDNMYKIELSVFNFPLNKEMWL